MKILWYSATPECKTGYGNAGRNMIKWLIEQGHYVVCATKHSSDVRQRTYAIPGTDYKVLVMVGTNQAIVNRAIIDKLDIDVCLSMFDVGALAVGDNKPLKRHIPWIPIDSQEMHNLTAKAVRETPIQIAMTEHGFRAMQAEGFEPEYAPIGYDPEVFYPRLDAALEFREKIANTWKDGLSADDMWLIGSVGLNYIGDRKGYIDLLRAFKKFREEYPEARLYLHTQARKDKEGMNYDTVAKQMEVLDYVRFPDQDRYFYDDFTEDEMAIIYSSFDVFCLPTLGEGFGMPTIEAQACGTPVVVTDNTSGRQLTKSGCIILTQWEDRMYTGNGTWRVKPHISEIVRALKVMRERSRYNRILVSQQVAEYQWQNVWDTYWTPIMQKIEDMLPLDETDEMMSIRGE